MNAAEVKDVLRRRHPAVQTFVNKGVSKDAPGVWTCLEEWQEIDLVAISSWKTPPSGAQGKGAHWPRIGYEVKVARSDLRRELLTPGKQIKARHLCNEFYYAVPEGLMKPEEIAFEQPPDMPRSAWLRDLCGSDCRALRDWLTKAEIKRRGLRSGLHVQYDIRDGSFTTCEECGGKGYIRQSQVEREFPNLWIPPEFGLVEVSESGRCRVRRSSPVYKEDQLWPLTLAQVHALVRWSSARPDPRHAELRQQTTGP